MNREAQVKSYHLRTLFILMLLIASTFSIARWAAAESPTGGFATLVLHMLPTLLAVGTRDWNRGIRTIATPLIVAMIPVLVLAAWMYGRVRADDLTVAPTLYVLLLSWALQFPLVAYVLLRKPAKKQLYHPLLIDVARLRKVVVNIPSIGPAFELPVEAWRECRAVLSPGVRVPGSPTSQGSAFAG